MSILDKASLIQIPSGYKNGKLYSVKPTPTYGSELVTNGDFATNSDWNLQSSASISQNKLIVSNAAQNTTIATQSSVAPTQKPCKLQFDIVVNTGSFRILLGSGGTTTTVTESGTYTLYETSGNFGTLTLQARDGGFDGSIDNVSVKEATNIGDFDFSRSSSATRANSEGLIETAQVLGSEEVTNGDFSNGGANWNYTIGVWDFSSGLASCNGTQSGLSYLNQSGAIVSGKLYKATYEITSISAGEIRIFVGDVSGLARTTTGVYTEYITAASTNFWLRVNSTFVGSIDNVSVKEVFENDVPRLDYSGGASCASLLLEPQRTNLIPYSESFDNAAWTKSEVNVQADVVISPDGTTNADLIKENSANALHWIGDSITVTSGESYTVSVFAKKKERSVLQIILSTNFLPASYANYDLDNGLVSASGGNITTKIDDYENGWFRCSITFTATSSASGTPLLALQNSTTASRGASYQGDGTSGLYLWGAMVEQGSYPTSYIISNSGSTTTRTADVCNNAGTSATFNDSEGVLFAEIAALTEVGDGTTRLSISDGSQDNNITIGYSATNTLRTIIRSGASNQALMTSSQTITNYLKVGIKYKANDFALWVNGVEVATDTSGLAPVGLSELSFDRGDAALPFYGKCKQLMVFDEALSDEELSDLTGQVNLSFNNLATFYDYTIL